jgi:hypothetical protein
MKTLLPAVLILSLFFTSCNQHPPNEAQKITPVDSGMPVNRNESDDSIVLSEPIVSSAKHYFSDPLSQDSFVAELPKGNIYRNSLYLKIYAAGNELIFVDSLSPTVFLSSEIYGYGTVQPQVVSKDLHRGIAALFEEANFSLTGDKDAIKNASAAQISNMIGWNEAVADSNQIVFSFFDAYPGTSYVTYSKKLKKGVVILKVPSEEDGD